MMAVTAPVSGIYLKVKDGIASGKDALWRIVAVDGDDCWLEDCRTLTEWRVPLDDVHRALAAGRFQVIAPAV